MEIDANPLAVWIRRFLIVAGYAIGISGVAQALLLPFIWRPAFGFLRLYGALKPVYLLFLFASAVSPAMLLIGIFGFHKRKRWARRYLLIYIATCIGAALGFHVVTLIAELSVFPGRGSMWIRAGFGLIQFVNFVEPCVYPLLLLLCLMRPEFRDNFAESQRGFWPLLNSDPPASDERPIPAESVELEGRL